MHSDVESTCAEFRYGIYGEVDAIWRVVDLELDDEGVLENRISIILGCALGLWKMSYLDTGERSRGGVVLFL